MTEARAIVAELFEYAMSQPEPDWSQLPGATTLRRDAADEARFAAHIIATEGNLTEAWRFGILQTLDVYTSLLRAGEANVARHVFDREPAPTGARQIDAAIAALAAHLAHRDDWQPPEWATDPRRATSAWYPGDPGPGLRAIAHTESPPEFRKRGIFIAKRDLSRA